MESQKQSSVSNSKETFPKFGEFAACWITAVLFWASSKSVLALYCQDISAVLNKVCQ